MISENHLNREFQASKPNEKWVTDITYLIFNGQRLYLSAIKDLYNNEIVAYETSRRNDSFKTLLGESFFEKFPYNNTYINVVYSKSI